MRADGVFSGAGAKGVAFAGALKAAEEVGYDEWVRLAGTSEGAITAMALALGYDADEVRLLLDEVGTGRLADTGRLAREIVNVLTRRSLARGKALQQWLRDVVAQAPRRATTFGELDATTLRVLGADLAHRRIVVLPDDLALYEDERGAPIVPDAFPIADAVRISASYPFFFPPVELRDRTTKKMGVLVDGGVASAFPVFLFDDPNPHHPTWGFRLSGGDAPERSAYDEIHGPDWPVEMVRAVLETSMNASDEHALLAFGDRTVSIPTGDVPTLQFNLTRAQRDMLYGRGYEAARAFFAAQPTGRNSFGQVPTQLQPERALLDPAALEWWSTT